MIPKKNGCCNQVVTEAEVDNKTMLQNCNRKKKKNKGFLEELFNRHYVNIKMKQDSVFNVEPKILADQY